MRRASLAIIILLLVLVPTYVPRVNASSPTQYSLSVTSGTVSVSINLNMLQNITSFVSSFVLPRVHVSAVGANSTDLANILQTAIQSKNPQAKVSNLNLQIGASPWINATSRQWLNESLNFDVTGVVKPKGQLVQADLSWKSFAASTGYSPGGVEVNRIGGGYLSGVATTLANQGQSQLVRFFYLVNGRPIDAVQFPNAVGNLYVLNFSSFATPVSEWQHTYVALASSESWYLAGARALGMSLVEEVQEAGTTVRTQYGFFYDLTGTVTATGNARVVGDTVTVVVSGFLEVVMAGIILSTIVLWSGALFFERRIQSKVSRKKPKR